MNFTKNESLAFRNFDDCYNHWYDLSQTNVEIDIEKVFVVERRWRRERGPLGRSSRDGEILDEENRDGMKGGRRRHKHPRQSATYLLSHLQ